MLQAHIRRALLVTLALAVPVSTIGVSSAMATPKGEYAAFAQCPLNNTELAGCIVSRTESGDITIGKQEVAIVKTQTLQGGVINESGGVKEMVAALNGETLTKASQKIPGGSLDLVRCSEIKGEGFFEKLARTDCEGIVENGSTEVNATTELAAPASSVTLRLVNAELESGTALTLPLKVKLENPLLGKECYIGSNSNPITLHLTTGKSGSVKGKLGEISTRAEGGILVGKDSTLVDNTFSAPKVTGCGGFFSFLIDSIIDKKLGLPAAAGVNTAVLNTTLEVAGSGSVLESEE